MGKRTASPVGTRAYLLATITGEVKPDDIPLAASVTPQQYEALMAGDDDPHQVVIEIGPGKGGRGWNYTEPALKRLVDVAASQTLAGFLGHQREENLGNEFPQPVTHWIGAKWQDGKALFRGVVDKTAPDLKRWIRAGRITQPSIFTKPMLQTRPGGETDVVDLTPFSIDWAPLGRAGMDSARLVYSGNGEMSHLPNSTAPFMAWGEMAEGDTPGSAPRGGSMPLTHAELLAALADERTDKAILLRDLGVTLDDVKRVFTAGEMAAAMTTDERRAIVVAEHKAARARKPAARAFGEIADPAEALVSSEDFRLKLADALGLEATASDDDVLSAIRREREALDGVTSSSLASAADGVLAEMHLPEPVLPLFRKELMSKLPNGAALRADPKRASVEAIRTLAGEIKEEPVIKSLLESLYAGGGGQVPRSNGQAAGEMTPLRLQTDAGFVFERRAI